MVEGGRKEKPSAALARTRPVFRGLRRASHTAGDARRIIPPCKDETRFQGIATWGIAGGPCRPPDAHLQGRDPFSGDCDLSGSLTKPRPDRTLARTRPVFRGLRPRLDPERLIWPKPALQGRDPFSGDCDTLFSIGRKITSSRCLQGRDPFSGDCDYTRWVALNPCKFPLQGRDPFSGDCDRDSLPGTPRRTPRLARTRPVFRGLRPSCCSHRPPAQPIPCKDETRFQGIATTAKRSRVPGSRSSLARTRPVFRGLRPDNSPDTQEWHLASCKDETRFQGIATRYTGRGRAGTTTILQGRDPFSGDCDSPTKPLVISAVVCRLARTRPVFRGLRHAPRGRGAAATSRALAGTRPVFRGLQCRGDPPGRPCVLIAGPVFRGWRRREGAGDEADRVGGDRRRGRRDFRRPGFRGMPAPPSSPARPGKKGAGGAAPRPPLLIGSRRAGPPLRREEAARPDKIGTHPAMRPIPPLRLNPPP